MLSTLPPLSRPHLWGEQSPSGRDPHVSRGPSSLYNLGDFLSYSWGLTASLQNSANEESHVRNLVWVKAGHKASGFKTRHSETV